MATFWRRVLWVMSTTPGEQAALAERTRLLAELTKVRQELMTTSEQLMLATALVTLANNEINRQRQEERAREDEAHARRGDGTGDSSAAGGMPARQVLEQQHDDAGEAL